MKKGSKLCQIKCLDGSVHHTFFTEAERKMLYKFELSISERKIGLLRSVDETHFEEIAVCVKKSNLPEVF